VARRGAETTGGGDNKSGKFAKKIGRTLDEDVNRRDQKGVLEPAQPGEMVNKKNSKNLWK